MSQRDDIVTVGGGSRMDRSRRIAVGVAVAVVAMLGGAAVAYAATNSTASPSAQAAAASPSPSQSPAPGKCQNANAQNPDAPCRPFGGPFHRFGVLPGAPFGLGFPGGMFGIVHGQVVQAKPGGGYQTVDLQRGKVTAVSTGSITVRSSDGFSASYAVTASTLVDAQRDGIGSVKAGNQVSVTATVSGSKAMATSITDITLLGQGRTSVGYSWSAVG